MKLILDNNQIIDLSEDGALELIAKGENVNEFQLGILSKAYNAGLAMNHLTKEYTTPERNNIIYLGEYAWLKDENGFSQSTFYDAIVELLNQGKTVGDLMMLDKWSLLEECYRVIPQAY